MIFLCGLGLWATEALSESEPCPEAHATVVFEDQSQALMACAAAKNAIGFWAGWDLAGLMPVTIEVVEGLTPVHGRHLFAMYDAPTKTIKILSLTASQELVGAKPVFGMALDRELYRSFLVHEVAHAVADQIFAVKSPSIAAHEYIAYVAQLATMPSSLRDRILSRASVEGFVDEYEVSEIYLGFNPEHFALKSYLHYTHPENGKAFVNRLLTGDFVPESGFD